MKKEKFNKLITNNNFIKYYIRLLKEESKYYSIYDKQNDFIAKSRYEDCMEGVSTANSPKIINSLYFIINVPDILINTTVEYETYLNLHIKYCSSVIGKNVINTLLKAIYENIKDENQKKLFISNRRKIKNDIENTFINKIKKEKSHINLIKY